MLRDRNLAAASVPFAGLGKLVSSMGDAAVAAAEMAVIRLLAACFAQGVFGFGRQAPIEPDWLASLLEECP